MNSFTIHGEMVDLNTYIQSERGNRFAGSKLKKEETQRVYWEAKSQHMTAITEYPVIVSFVWYTKDLRKDVDNVAFAKKFILDGLVEAGVLKGDGRKFITGIRDLFEVDKNNPRTEVEIITINERTI